jgi:hypothetical protein
MTAYTPRTVDLPGSLIQIRRGYSTGWYDLRLSVERDEEGWKAQVREPNDGRTLYTAHRYSLDAAKIAATEFAIFRKFDEIGPKNPEAMAQHLRWNESW